MPRVPPLEREETNGDGRAQFDRELARFGRLTNMKRTLLRSPRAYHALMEWYPLFDAIKEFLGEHLAIVFADRALECAGVVVNQKAFATSYREVK